MSLDYTPPSHLATSPSLPVAQASLNCDTEWISQIQDAGIELAGWVNALGPVEDWSHIFCVQYNEACLNTSFKYTQTAIDIFLQNVQNHINYRKQLLNCPGPATVIQEQWSQDGAADWLLCDDIISTLHQDIVILEARLDIYMPSGPLHSELQSDIHRYKGFEVE